jgi:hypothetical protein
VHSNLVRHTIGTSGSSTASPGHWPRPIKEDKVIAANRVTLGGLACGLALLLAACGSGGLSDNGPFGNSGQNSGTLCYPVRPGGVVQDGFEEYYDTGGTATIDKVVLVHPRHLRLVAAWVSEQNGPVAVALGGGYPHPTRTWQHAAGAVVHHTHGDEVITLVAVVKLTGKLGTASAINMYYHIGGIHYLRHFTDGLHIFVGHKC